MSRRLPTVQEAVSGILLFPRPCSCQELIRIYPQLVLTEPSLQRGEYWRLLTHLFLHRDVEHLCSNLLGLLCSGLSVFRSLGVLGVYGGFLVGGAVAGLNSWGRSFQTEEQLRASIPDVPRSLSAAVPQSQRLWDVVRTAAAKWTAPVVCSRTEAFGCSGGVCSLLGLSVGLSLHRLYSRSRRPRPSELSGAQARRCKVENRLVTALNVCQSGHFLVQESPFLCFAPAVSLVVVRSACPFGVIEGSPA